MIRPLILLCMLSAGAAQADISVTFQDGAPKDRFTITNTAACATGPVTLTIDLSTAPAGLIFDTTDAGDGVEVFQPFELVSGADFVTGASAVRDGDQTLMLQLSDLAANAEVLFTIDMDDTGGGREITVSGSETAGVMVVVEGDFARAAGVFDETGTAQVALAGCLS